MGSLLEDRAGDVGCLAKYSSNGTELGKGAAGVVRASCRVESGVANPSQCGYVRKTSVLNTEDDRDQFRRDAFYARRLDGAAPDLVPKVACAAQVPNEGGVLILERFDMDAATLGRKQFDDEVAKNATFKKLIDGVKPLLNALQSAGIVTRLYTEVQLKRMLTAVGALYGTHKVVHGDMTPRNLLYRGGDGRFVITDFGTAGDDASDLSGKSKIVSRLQPTPTTNALECWRTTNTIPDKFHAYYNVWQLKVSLTVNSVTFIKTTGGTSLLRGIGASAGLLSQSTYQVLGGVDPKLLPESVDDAIASYCPLYQTRVALLKPVRDALAKQVFEFTGRSAGAATPQITNPARFRPRIRSTPLI